MENIYSELNASIFRFIVAAYDNNDFRALQQMGLNDTHVKRVIDMPMMQFERLKSRPWSIAQISFDPRRLDVILDDADHEHNLDEIKNTMIRMQASAAMLQALTGMDIAEYRKRRDRLGLDKAQQGRPAALSPDESIRLAEAWSRHHEAENPLFRYYRVGVDTGIPLNKVWAYMCQEN